MTRLVELNALDEEDFVERIGGIYEHSPWVAEAAWQHRPFASVAALHAAMHDAVLSSGAERQLALIRAHPELAGKLAAAELTEASRGEQVSAGLDRCTAGERAQLQDLNRRYREKFDFPFIVAVRGLNWSDIIARATLRLADDREREIATALAEIGRIARFRLADALPE
jgi:2-oxo-4-hydroxy-4-carboxy-5-ureidoimidazoline decarboxylase